MSSIGKSKRRIAASLIFCALGALACWGIGRFFDLTISNPTTSSWTAYRRQPKGSIELLVIGNSHVYYGYQPTVAFRERDVYSWALAASTLPPRGCLAFLQEALKSQSPKTVAVELYLMTVPPTSGSFPQRMPVGLPRLSAAWDTDKANTLNAVIPAVGQHANYERILSPKDALGGSFPEYAGGAVVGSLFSSKPDSTLQKTWFYRDLSTEEKSCIHMNGEYLAEIVRLCERNSISPVFWLAPMYRAEDSADYLAAVQESLNSWGIDSSRYKIIDCNQPDVFEQNDWFDATPPNSVHNWNSHVNYSGSKKVTLMLLDRLSLSHSPSSRQTDLEKRWREYISDWDQRAAAMQ
ncbi:MAG: hypothetical protein LBS17_04470 [Actinomycetes bacterium]|nr:hypothetical protein [Actinomycetes bacterium]